LQGRLHGPESLSRELFTAALKLAENHDLLQTGGEDAHRWDRNTEDVDGRLYPTYAPNSA
jgi:glycerol-3-phosphate O-acyltransferase